jgi:hypothetical protein
MAFWFLYIADLKFYYCNNNNAEKKGQLHKKEKSIEYSDDNVYTETWI